MSRVVVLTGIMLAAIAVAFVFRSRRAPDSTRHPAIRFAVGDRVQVREPGFWADGAVGSIATPPPGMVQLAGGWRGHLRMAQTATGVRPFYWVRLDEARRDADGDGPYQEAEIAENSMAALTTSGRP